MYEFKVLTADDFYLFAAPCPLDALCGAQLSLARCGLHLSAAQVVGLELSGHRATQSQEGVWSGLYYQAQIHPEREAFRALLVELEVDPDLSLPRAA